MRIRSSVIGTRPWKASWPTRARSWVRTESAPSGWGSAIRPPTSNALRSPSGSVARHRRRFAAQLRDRALGDLAAVGDDDDVVDGLLDLGEQVAGDEDRFALTGEVAQEAAQPPDALGVQAVGRFVEQQHVGVAEQGGGQAEALAHPHGIAPGAFAGGGRDADLLEQLVGPSIRYAARGREHPEVVPPGAARVEVGRLEGRADGAQRVGQVAIAPTADGRGAGAGSDQPEQHPQGGRLAGAVRSEEAGDPAGLHLEVEVVDSDELAEAFGQAGGRDRVPPCAGAPPPGGWLTGVARPRDTGRGGRHRGGRHRGGRHRGGRHRGGTCGSRCGEDRGCGGGIGVVGSGGCLRSGHVSIETPVSAGRIRRATDSGSLAWRIGVRSGLARGDPGTGR